MTQVTNKQILEALLKLNDRIEALESAEPIESSVPFDEPMDFDEHSVLNADWTAAKIAKAKEWSAKKGLKKGQVIVWHVRSKAGKDSVIFNQKKSGRPSNAVGNAIATV